MWGILYDLGGRYREDHDRLVLISTVTTMPHNYVTKPLRREQAGPAMYFLGRLILGVFSCVLPMNTYLSK